MEQCTCTWEAIAMKGDVKSRPGPASQVLSESVTHGHRLCLLWYVDDSKTHYCQLLQRHRSPSFTCHHAAQLLLSSVLSSVYISSKTQPFIHSIISTRSRTDTMTQSMKDAIKGQGSKSKHSGSQEDTPHSQTSRRLARYQPECR